MMREKRETKNTEETVAYKEYLAGLLAGVATVITDHLFDTVKVKLQKHNTEAHGIKYKNGCKFKEMTPWFQKFNRYSSPLDCALQTVKNEGFWTAVLPLDVAKTIIQTSPDKSSTRNPFLILYSGAVRLEEVPLIYFHCIPPLICSSHPNPSYDENLKHRSTWYASRGNLALLPPCYPCKLEPAYVACIAHPATKIFGLL
uniref:Uncharacterized protein n=1 Tax=Salix viminalis TaxID=40686 RepID=A0A6N2KXN0_SALVM